MKIVFLLLTRLLILVSIIAQINGSSDVVQTESINPRINLDKLDKWRNVWKALCDQWCPQSTYMTFPHLSRRFCTTKCSTRLPAVGPAMGSTNLNITHNFAPSTLNYIAMNPQIIPGLAGIVGNKPSSNQGAQKPHSTGKDPPGKPDLGGTVENKPSSNQGAQKPHSTGKDPPEKPDLGGTVGNKPSSNQGAQKPHSTGKDPPEKPDLGGTVGNKPSLNQGAQKPHTAIFVPGISG